MGRRRRKTGRKSGERGDRPQDPGGANASQATAGRRRKPLVPWRERTREVLRSLRDWSRARYGPCIETHLRQVFGDGVDTAPIADLERVFDDVLCQPESAGDGRSIVRAYAEDAEDLSPEERTEILRWEKERQRQVYLLDRAHRDHLELWDPVRGGRMTLHLLERMAAGQTAALGRGTVVIAVAVPWGPRLIALGHTEVYDDDEAVDLYRREVRGQGRVWQDLPAVVPRA